MSSAEEYGDSMLFQWKDSQAPPPSSALASALASPRSQMRWNQLRPRGVPMKMAQPRRGFSSSRFLKDGPSIGRMPMVQADSAHCPASSQTTPSRPSETSEFLASADLIQ